MIDYAKYWQTRTYFQKGLLVAIVLIIGLQALHFFNGWQKNEKYKQQYPILQAEYDSKLKTYQNEEKVRKEVRDRQIKELLQSIKNR